MRRYLFPLFLVLLAALLTYGYTYSHAQERVVPGSAMEMQLSFSPLVKQVSPAVVNIYTKRVVSRQVANPFMADPFFGRFFQNSPFGSRMRQQVENSLGSGVIIEADGLIVTNAHVIKGAQEITVALADGREFPAELALADEASDLALLRIRESGLELPYVTLKASESLEVGDLVLAIGNPFGVGQTVTSGIVSAQGRSTLNINDFNFFIQTDAAINPGNSGGPLVALDGQVVGINTAIYSRDGGSLGIGFAIPSEMVATIIAAEKQGRTGEQGVARAWLGFTGQNVTSDIANSLGFEKPGGVLISKLHPESPLVKAGVKQGDIILAVNGRVIRDGAEMKFRMATVPIGETAAFEISRKGKTKTLHVKAMGPPEKPARDDRLIDGHTPLQGARLSNLNPAVAVELGMMAESGVVVLETEQGSSAARLVRPGDIIVSINGVDVETMKDVPKALKARSEGFVLVLNRNGRTQRIVLR